MGREESRSYGGIILQADGTTVQVLQQDGLTPEAKSYLGLYRIGREGPAVVLYDYQKTRAGSHPKAFLAGLQEYRWKRTNIRVGPGSNDTGRRGLGAASDLEPTVRCETRLTAWWLGRTLGLKNIFQVTGPSCAQEIQRRIGMKGLVTIGLSSAVAASLLLAGGSAFAATTFNPTIEYVSPVSGGYVNVKVSGISSTETVYVTFEDEVGGTWKVAQEYRITQSPPNPWYDGQVGTILFNVANAGVAVAVNPDATALRVLEGTQESIGTQTVGNSVPLQPLPYGQLPEVPFTAAIPVLGIGAALLLRRRLAH